MTRPPSLPAPSRWAARRLLRSIVLGRFLSARYGRGKTEKAGKTGMYRYGERKVSCHAAFLLALFVSAREIEIDARVGGLFIRNGAGPTAHTYHTQGKRVVGLGFHTLSGLVPSPLCGVCDCVRVCVSVSRFECRRLGKPRQCFRSPQRQREFVRFPPPPPRRRGWVVLW